MSSGTLDLLQGFLTPDLLRQAARATGETEGGVAKAMGAAFPALLGQMAQGMGNAGTMGALADLLKSPAVGSVLGQGGGIFSQVGSMLGQSGASSPLGSVASTLISMLFGKNVGGLVGALGSLAGLRNSGSAGSLLALAAPIVLGALRSRLGDAVGGLTGAALGGLLGREKDQIMGALPGPLAGVMGLVGSGAAGLAGSVAAGQHVPQDPPARPAAAPAPVAPPAPAPAAAPAARHAEAPASGGSTVMGSILGLLLTGAIIAALVFLLSQCNRVPTPPV